MISFKKNCPVGFLVSLSMQSSLAAMKNYEMRSTEVISIDEAKARFRKLISDWIENNPEQTGQIAKQLIDLVDDFENCRK